MRLRERNWLVWVTHLLAVSQALAAWWVTVPDVAVKHGYRKHQGPFDTKAAAEAYWRTQGFGATPIVTSDGADAHRPQANQSDALRPKEEEDRRRTAEERAEAESAARERASREAEDIRRFEKVRADAITQLKGFNPDNESGLKDVSVGEGSGLREVSGPAAATVHLDAMVVDLRDLTSGLPKSVDDAIPRTASGNRVRKGFQAIAQHDWATAVLWFKDAYNREPGDPGLQRLVDLAQYTLEAQAMRPRPLVHVAVTSGPSAPAPDPDSRVPASSQAASPEIPASRGNSIARAAAAKIAAEARVQQVYAELRKRYGPEIPFVVRYSLDTNTKIQRARDGEGLSKEEMNAQLEAALREFLSKQRQFDPAGVGGAVVADEIILGGKG